MKRLLFLSATLALGTAAFAQGYGDPYYRGYPDRDGYRYREYVDRGVGGSPVDRAITDLQRVRVGWFDHHNEKHVNKALHELSEFQDKLYRRNHWDGGDLDAGIEAMQHTVDSGRLGGRDREMLYNDLAALRDFRATRGRPLGYGGYPDYPR